jgi:hypothetical protein
MDFDGVSRDEREIHGGMSDMQIFLKEDCNQYTFEFFDTKSLTLFNFSDADDDEDYDPYHYDYDPYHYYPPFD